jgi:hypothetical protein
MIIYISYFALAMSFIGIYFNANRRHICWVIWAIADIAWFVFGFYTGQYQIAILHTGYMISNIYGYRKWNKPLENSQQNDTV